MERILKLLSEAEEAQFVDLQTSSLGAESRYVQLLQLDDAQQIRNVFANIEVGQHSDFQPLDFALGRSALTLKRLQLRVLVVAKRFVDARDGDAVVHAGLVNAGRERRLGHRDLCGFNQCLGGGVVLKTGVT